MLTPRAISKEKEKLSRVLVEKSTEKSQPRYDAIVVGAGPAGSTAAYFMAKEGLSVLLFERGSYPGSKNCGGANLAAEPVHALFPDFWEEFELERITTNQRYWFMAEDSFISIGVSHMRLAAAPYNRFSIKRPKFYQWLADKAIDAGAILKLSHRVDKVLMDGSQAVGVQVSEANPNMYFADIIVLADGSNCLLAERAGIVPQVSPSNLSLYVKETIGLPPEVITERFNLPSGHGSVIGLIGYPTAGFNGTASIHTFKESININVGLSLDKFVRSQLQPYELLQRIKKHNYIKPLLAGGEVLEYGSALLPEGGYQAIPEIVHPGLMIVGDAASLVNGTHGFHLAMWSGYFAAQAAIVAKHNRDFSAKRLRLYRTLLDESFIIQDLKTNAGVTKFEQDIPYFFDTYSRMMNEAAYQVVKIYTMPKKAKRVFIYKKITSMQSLKKIVVDTWKLCKAALG